MTVNAEILLLVLLLISGCATAPYQTASALQRAETAAAIVRETYDPAGPGAAYLLSKNGDVLVAGAVGYANLEWDAEMKPDTPVRIGSLSKPITAVMVLQLVEEGLVELDRPIAAYAPDLPDQFGAVTLRQLLSHRSGLADFLSDPALMEHIWLPITTDKLIDLARDAPASSPPGTKYEYVNFNYVLVAHVIEKITGRPYRDAVDSFFDETGMTNSHFDAHDAIIENRAAAYELRDGGVFNTPGLDMSHVSAAGALLSSAEDLNRWIMLLTAEELIGRESLDMAWTPEPLPEGEATAYGLGFNVREFCGARTIWHTGLAPGGQASFMLAPEKGLFAIVLSNAYNTPNTGKLTRRMFAMLLTGQADAPCAAG
ncbi:serine hydrolase domain-containing protein [Hyphococcus sp.]|jgi:CubicO group peptidase (beta-lactamase class C family)|uniref:serine hydrolase domain-containing protein n=1 Tax=Hyphococcus sp. TaxID=2038636 RepID=UPI003D0CC1E5